MLHENVKIFKEIVSVIVKHNSEYLIIVVTNLVDVLTCCTYVLSNFSANRVIGSGTVLNFAWLCYLIGEYFEVSPKNVSAPVFGEHGK